jgi:hypothetical protein
MAINKIKVGTVKFVLIALCFYVKENKTTLDFFKNIIEKALYHKKIYNSTKILLDYKKIIFSTCFFVARSKITKSKIKFKIALLELL